MSRRLPSSRLSTLGMTSSVPGGERRRVIHLDRKLRLMGIAARILIVVLASPEGPSRCCRPNGGSYIRMHAFRVGVHLRCRDCGRATCDTSVAGHDANAEARKSDDQRQRRFHQRASGRVRASPVAQAGERDVFPGDDISKRGTIRLSDALRRAHGVRIVDSETATSWWRRRARSTRRWRVLRGAGNVAPVRTAGGPGDASARRTSHRASCRWP